MKRRVYEEEEKKEKNEGRRGLLYLVCQLRKDDSYTHMEGSPPANHPVLLTYCIRALLFQSGIV